MADMEAAILQLFRGKEKRWKKKNIVKKIRTDLPDATKKEVKRAIKKLVKDCKLSKDEKVFTLTNQENADESQSIQEEIPIAEVLRRRKGPKKNNEKETTTPENLEKQENDSVEDIDEEIRRLEAELAADSGDGSEEDVDDDEETVTSGQPEIDDNGGVLCLSALATERIAPLPEAALPFNKRRYMKIDKEIMQENGNPPSKRQKKEKKERKKEKQPHKISEGLQAAVKEVLNGYKPRSNEKLPFYCRQCAKQYNNEEEFFAHRKTEFHKAAVAVEKKATYCKLCRKQLTSPVQMKEHLVSKKHKDLLQKMRNKQEGRR